MAADYVEHTEHAVPPGARPGRDSVKRRIALYYEAFPDWKVTIHDIFGRGDGVAYRWSASGTHLGEWAGLSPTGLHMTTGGITILRSEEHTSELQSRQYLVCRLLLEKKKKLNIQK